MPGSPSPYTFDWERPFPSFLSPSWKYSCQGQCLQSSPQKLLPILHPSLVGILCSLVAESHSICLVPALLATPVLTLKSEKHWEHVWLWSLRNTGNMNTAIMVWRPNCTSTLFWLAIFRTTKAEHSQSDGHVARGVHFLYYCPGPPQGWDRNCETNALSIPTVVLRRGRLFT